MLKCPAGLGPVRQNSLYVEMQLVPGLKQFEHSIGPSVNGISLYTVPSKPLFPQGPDPDLAGVNGHLSTCFGGVWTCPQLRAGSVCLRPPAPCFPLRRAVLCRRVLCCSFEGAIVPRQEGATRKTVVLCFLMSTRSRKHSSFPLVRPP